MNDTAFLDYVNSPQQSSGNDPGDFAAFLNAGEATDSGGGGSFADFLNQQDAPAKVTPVNAVPVKPEVVDNGKGRIRSAGESFMRAGGEQMGQTASFLSRTMRTINDFNLSELVTQLGGTDVGSKSYLEKAIQGDPLYRIGQAITDGAREAYEPNPKYAGEFVTDILASGAGGLFPSIATGLINPYLGIAQGASVSGQQGAEEAIAAGRPDVANRTAGVNALVTAVSEPFLGVVGNLKRFRRVADGSLSGKLVHAGVGESLQEVIEQVGQNKTASTIAGYDPERKWHEGVPTAMAAGGILGPGVAGAVHLVSPSANDARAMTAAKMLADEAAGAKGWDVPLVLDPNFLPSDDVKPPSSNEFVGPKQPPSAKEVLSESLVNLLNEEIDNRKYAQAPLLQDPSMPELGGPKPPLSAKDMMAAELARLLNGEVDSSKSGPYDQQLILDPSMTELGGPKPPPSAKDTLSKALAELLSKEADSHQPPEMPSYINAGITAPQDGGPKPIPSTKEVLSETLAKILFEEVNNQRSIEDQSLSDPNITVDRSGTLKPKPSAKEVLAETLAKLLSEEVSGSSVREKQLILDPNALQDTVPNSAPSVKAQLSEMLSKLLDKRVKRQELLADPSFWNQNIQAPENDVTEALPTTKEIRSRALAKLLENEADQYSGGKRKSTVPMDSDIETMFQGLDNMRQEFEWQNKRNVPANPRSEGPIDTTPTPVLATKNPPWPVVPIQAVTPTVQVAPVVTQPRSVEPTSVAPVVLPRTLIEAGRLAPEYPEPALNPGRAIPDKAPKTLTDNRAKAMEIVSGDPVKLVDLTEFLNNPQTEALIQSEAAKYPEVPGMADQLRSSVADKAALFLSKKPRIAIGENGGFPVKKVIQESAKDVKKTAYVQRNELTVDDENSAVIPDTSLTPDQIAIANEEGANEELKARGFMDLVYKTLGLNADEISALRSRFIPGSNKTSLNPKARALIESADFNNKFRDVVNKLRENYDVTMEEFRDYLTRYSVANANPGVALDTKTVQDFVAKEFPKLARFVEIIDDPTALTPAGKRWDGKLTIAPNKAPTITLNLANLGSLNQLARTMAEEAVHIVFQDPSVKSAFESFSSTVTDSQLEAASSDGYSQNELMEEVLVKAAAGRFSTNRQKAAWRRLVDSIWAAVSRFFGINPSIEMVQDMIVAKALSGDSIGATDNAGNITRYSVFDQDFKNSKEVTAAKAVPGADVNVIEEVALAKGSILPQSFIDTINSYRKGPITPATNTKAAFKLANGAHLRAAGNLRPLFGLLELTDQGINRLHLNQVTPEAADMAHRSVLRGFDQVYSLEQKLNTTLGVLQAAYLSKAGKLSEALQADINGQFAKGATARLMGLYDQYLNNEIALTNPNSTIGGQRLATLQAAKKQLGLQHDNLAVSVPAALQVVANAMPKPKTVTALNTPQELVNWLKLQERTQWPAFNNAQPMNDTTFQFLAVDDPINNIPPALISSPNVIDEVFELRRLTDDKAHHEQLKTNMVSAFKGLGGFAKSNITPRKFAAQYAKWRDAHREAVETSARINGDFALAEERLRGMILAIDEIEKLRADPQFNGQVKLAAERMEQVTDKVITSTFDGSWRFLNPGAPVGSQELGDYTTFSLAPNSVEIQDNAKKAISYLSSIEQWKASVQSNPSQTNPGLERTYEYAKRLVSGYMMDDLRALNLTGHQSLVPFTYDWLGSLPKNVVETISLVRPGSYVVSKVNDLVSMVAPGTKGRSSVVRLLGGQASRIAFDFLERTDLSDRSIKSAESHRTYGTQARRVAMIKQMKEHGFDVSTRYYGESIALYVDQVLEPLIASRQNPSQSKLGVGDWTPFRRQIKQGDIDLALLETEYKNALHSSARQGASPANLKSTFGVKDSGYSRKAAGYDLKSKRGSSEWADKFSQIWIRAIDHDKIAGGTTARMALLADPNNFDSAVNGEVMETNIEYTSGRSDPQYKAYQNRVGNKASQPTFLDMNEFLDWMSQARLDIVLATKGPNTSTLAAERNKAFSILLTDIEKTARAVAQNGRQDIELESGPLTGVGKAVTDVITGESSFTNKRGRMIGPSTYYNYSIAKDAERLKYNASYKLVFQKREMDIYRASVDALVLERDRQRKEQADWVQQHNKMPQVWEKYKFAAKQQSEVAAGQRIATLRSLDELINIMLQTIDGMKTKMENARVYEPGMLRMARSFESRVSVPKLFSAPVVSTNLISAIYIQPLMNDFAMARGRHNVLRSLTTATGLTGRAAMNIMRAATAMVTDTKMKRMLAQNPKAWMGMAKGLHDWTSKYTADREYLFQAGWSESDSTKESLKRWWTDTTTMPASSGAASNQDSSMKEAVLNVVTSPLSFFSILGGRLAAVGEQFGSVVQLKHYRDRFNAMRADVVRAFETRKATDPGWDDTTKPLRPFLPQEIGFDTHKALSWFRDMVAPVGAIENAFLNYYKRHLEAVKAGKNPLDVEIFEPEAMKQALYGIQKFGNVVSDSGRGDATHGKGWTGAARSALFRFANYGIQLTEIFRQSMAPDPRDAGIGRLKEAVTLVGLFATLAALALIALGSGQMLRELQNRRVPATATLDQLASDPSATAFYRAYLAGGANLFMPSYGEHINSIVTGQQGRNITDLTSMVPGIGAAAQLLGFAREVAQTGDLYYPSVKLAQSILPASQAVTSRTSGGEADLEASNAIRSLRSAAPLDVELRGQGSRMSENTPLIRDAQRALANNDQGAYRSAMGKAVALSTARGIPETQAIRSFVSSVRGRDPQMAVFGRRLEPAELQRVTSRMSDSQRSAFDGSMRSAQRLKSWVKKSKKKAGRVSASKRIANRLSRKRKKRSSLAYS